MAAKSTAVIALVVIIAIILIIILVVFITYRNKTVSDTRGLVSIPGRQIVPFPGEATIETKWILDGRLMVIYQGAVEINVTEQNLLLLVPDSTPAPTTLAIVNQAFFGIVTLQKVNGETSVTIGPASTATYLYDGSNFTLQ